MFQFIVATFLALSLAACGGGGGNGSVTPGALNVVATTFEASCADGTKPTSTVSMEDARGKCVGHGGTDTIEMPCIDPVSKTFSTCHTKIGPIVNDPLPVASTYAAQGLTEEAAAFELLNKERARCGFGTLKQNAALDQAAKNHADWSVKNNAVSHFEIQGTQGFTGIDLFDRIMATKNYGSLGDATDEETTVISGSHAVRNLLNAPFHMNGMLSGFRDIGISINNADGFRAFPVAVFNLAYTDTVGTQLQSGTDVLTYPCQGTTGTNYELTNETPNPVPGRDLRKNPLGGSIFVLLRFGHVLTITSATMIDPNGSRVTLRNPVVGHSGPTNMGYIAADAPLQPNTAYQVLINGTNNGTAFSRQFTFTTGTGG